MNARKIREYVKAVLENMPADWLKLTTHRLDIYDEKQAKRQFISEFERLYKDNITDTTALSALPTAYDYIRLGHPLSSVLEWVLAQLNNLNAENVISFQSRTMPIMAVLRKNLLEGKNTRILYNGTLPTSFDTDILQDIYGYTFELKQVDDTTAIPAYDGSTIFISQKQDIGDFELIPNIDFFIGIYGELGSIIAINGEQNKSYISEIQHVRRRETIAMTPANTVVALQLLTQMPVNAAEPIDAAVTKAKVLHTIRDITGSNVESLVASSGLSMQYAIVMGLIHEAKTNHAEKAIKIVVPTNCYGGTNDQARRVAASTQNVEIVDLAVDGDNDMVQSINVVLDTIATQDAVPFIIAEIPTNPRVEVPDIKALQEVLTKKRKTPNGTMAIDPVFILDQTFCPNVHFLGEADMLSEVSTIAYVSGSKFPSGGKCTAGYCVANRKAEGLMEKIALHLSLCDNEATSLQLEILAKQMPSMNQRIQDAYQNTRQFVNFIREVLPAAKINFVSEALAAQGFTPSVFSLDLPTSGETEAEREAYKRALNHKLIKLMITAIPDESKHCVSYGQLKGCYWTIPATSTQGTTKEGDKDYIARVAVSPDMDLNQHKKVFLEFVEEI